MKNAILGAFSVVMIALLLSNNSVAHGQVSPATSDQNNGSGNNAGFVIGHPFSAVKYARQVKVGPDGKQQFIRNERYPIQIARDADGRVMMQDQKTENLGPECDHLEMLVPPVCSVWGIVVVDPAAHTATGWTAGERGAHASINFPLSQAHFELAAHATAEEPDVPAPFTDEDGNVITVDLGDRTLEGVKAHGVRSTLRYTKTDLGQTIHVTRIHEVWTAPEMKLIIRVLDGDPNGVESVWGLEKITLSPDPSLFQPPADYEAQHNKTDKWIDEDFEILQSWFAK